MSSGTDPLSRVRAFQLKYEPPQLSSIEARTDALIKLLHMDTEVREMITLLDKISKKNPQEPQLTEKIAKARETLIQTQHAFKCAVIGKVYASSIEEFSHFYANHRTLESVTSPEQAEILLSQMFAEKKRLDPFNNKFLTREEFPSMEENREASRISHALEEIQTAFEVALRNKFPKGAVPTPSLSHTSKAAPPPLLAQPSFQSAEQWIQFCSDRHNINALLNRQAAEELHQHLLNTKQTLDPFTQSSLSKEPTQAALLQASSLSTRMEQSMLSFTNALLTKFPIAKITYAPQGSPSTPCIHPISPLAETDPLRTYSPPILYERKILGDGNCFYYSILTRYLEVCLHQSHLGQLIDRMHTDPLLNPELKNTLTFSLHAAIQAHSVEGLLKDPHQVLPFVYYLRLLAKQSLLNNQESLSLFKIAETTDDPSSNSEESDESFLNRKVLTMGTDATESIINALCDTLAFPITILIENASHLSTHHILSSSPTRPAFLRLKENHYSVLYPS